MAPAPTHDTKVGLVRRRAARLPVIRRPAGRFGAGALFFLSRFGLGARSDSRICLFCRTRHLCANRILSIRSFCPPFTLHSHRRPGLFAVWCSFEASAPYLHSCPLRVTRITPPVR